MQTWAAPVAVRVEVRSSVFESQGPSPVGSWFRVPLRLKPKDGGCGLRSLKP